MMLGVLTEKKRDELLHSLHTTIAGPRTGRCLGSHGTFTHCQPGRARLNSPHPLPWHSTLSRTAPLELPRCLTAGLAGIWACAVATPGHMTHTAHAQMSPELILKLLWEIVCEIFLKLSCNVTMVMVCNDMMCNCMFDTTGKKVAITNKWMVLTRILFFCFKRRPVSVTFKNVSYLIFYPQTNIKLRVSCHAIMLPPILIRFARWSFSFEEACILHLNI